MYLREGRNSHNKIGRFKSFMRGYWNNKDFWDTQDYWSWERFGNSLRHVGGLDHKEAIEVFHKEWNKLLIHKIENYGYLQVYHRGKLMGKARWKHPI